MKAVRLVAICWAVPSFVYAIWYTATGVIEPVEVGYGMALAIVSAYLAGAIRG